MRSLAAFRPVACRVSWSPNGFFVARFEEASGASVSFRAPGTTHADITHWVALVQARLGRTFPVEWGV
jgi:hypothetical protein